MPGPGDTSPLAEPLAPSLLAVLACPDSHHAPLDHDPAASTLTCTACGRTFQVDDGIPILLLDDDPRAAASSA